MPSKKKTGPTPVEAITHDDKRANLPTADAHEFVDPEMEEPKKLLYPRDPSLDPQLVWTGKDTQDADGLVVDAPPIYIQEKVAPRALIEELRRITAERRPGTRRIPPASLSIRPASHGDGATPTDSTPSRISATS